jgi:hypothetical protein
VGSVDDAGIRDGEGSPEDDAGSAMPVAPTTIDAGHGQCIGFEEGWWVIVVGFARDGATPLPAYDEVIQDVVDHLEANPAMKIAVVGYASSDELNPQKSSEARAAAVLARLVRAGISRKRLVARGEGSSLPRWWPGGSSDSKGRQDFLARHPVVFELADDARKGHLTQRMDWACGKHLKSIAP